MYVPIAVIKSQSSYIIKIKFSFDGTVCAHFCLLVPEKAGSQQTRIPNQNPKPESFHSVEQIRSLVVVRDTLSGPTQLFHWWQ